MFWVWSWAACPLCLMLFYWFFFLFFCLFFFFFFWIEFLWYQGSGRHPKGNLPSFLCPCLDLVNGIIFCFPATLSPVLSRGWYSIWEVLYLGNVYRQQDVQPTYVDWRCYIRSSSALDFHYLISRWRLTCPPSASGMQCGWVPFSWSSQTSADHI